MPSDSPIPGRCGSPMRKKPGKFCEKFPEKGSKRCKLHGGHALKGPAHPGWKNGRYSRYTTPGVLAEYVKRMEEDPDPLSSLDELIHMQAIGDLLLQRLSTGESGTAWQRLRNAMDRFVVAWRAEDGPSMLAAITDMRAAVDDGEGFQHAVADVVSHFDATRRTRETEIKRRQAEARAMTPEDALIILRHVNDVWAEAVKEVAGGRDEREVLSRVSAHIASLWREKDADARAN